MQEVSTYHRQLSTRAGGTHLDPLVQPAARLLHPRSTAGVTDSFPAEDQASTEAGMGYSASGAVIPTATAAAA